MYVYLDPDIPSLATRRSSLAQRRKHLASNKSDPNISTLQDADENRILSQGPVRLWMK
jgi:hypothetical protein